MKNLKVELKQKFKSYNDGFSCTLCGDLIILSGINGSGKSQLLTILSDNIKNKIIRSVTIDEQTINMEDVLYQSFKDNINLSSELGYHSISIRQNTIQSAWQFYSKNILYNDGKSKIPDALKANAIKSLMDNSKLYDYNGNKIQSWRSTSLFIKILLSVSDKMDIFSLNKDDFDRILPSNFLWRNENDIAQQLGNIFYIACCDKHKKLEKYGRVIEAFNETKWLLNAPWTILNNLFEKLGFKYRFKKNYDLSNFPDMDENPTLRFAEEIRLVNDLSDGEKTILKLALISMDESTIQNIKLAIFDEYDATLNPSLIEAFYYVIDEFYLKKNIQVIIATHSPSTISLAPNIAQFYEMFPQYNNSPKINRVNKNDYAEMRKANKEYFDKIKNQQKRITELEESIVTPGYHLLVEDKYYQIYKIAYLKLSNITEIITCDNINELFSKYAHFAINSGYCASRLRSVLTDPNASSDNLIKTICLFDFDSTGVSNFVDVSNAKTDESNPMFSDINGKNETGLFLKHTRLNRAGLLLPIPNELKEYANLHNPEKCNVEIESLLDKSFSLKNEKMYSFDENHVLFKCRDNSKKELWKDLIAADKTCFANFKPLFDTIEKIFNSFKN